MAAKNMEFDIFLKCFFFDNFFYLKALVLCPKMVLLIEYMVWMAIYIVVPGYCRILGNKCPLSL